MSFNVDVNTVIWLVIAILQLYNTYLVRRTEKNTNSMKDALVASTDKASRAEGHAAGFEEGIEQGREKRKP